MGKIQTLGENRKFTMFQPLKNLTSLLPLVAVAALLALSLDGCNSAKRLTKANVDQVSEGMSKKQVESILGPATTIDTKDFLVLKKTTYVYAQGKDSVTIIFKDDKMQSKVSTLSD